MRGLPRSPAPVLVNALQPPNRGRSCDPSPETPANPGDAGKAHYDRLYGTPDARRLPAYAKQLMEARQRGIKPWLVLCQLGGDWNHYSDLPKVCLSASEYGPGIFDFSCLRGLFVILTVEDGNQEQVLELAREIAQQHPAKILIRDGSGTFPPSDLEGW